MKIIQEDFITEISEVEKHLAFMDKLVDDIDQDSDNLAYYKSQSRKRFEYNSMIISLYGIVEKYTEKIIKRYIEEIETLFVSYSDINSKIKEKLFELSIQLLSKVIDKKYKKYEDIKKEDIIQNLNGCINKSGRFFFNKEAFILNSGNINHTKICEYFKNLDINIDQEIRKHKEFSLKTENLFNKLEDLVQRRNEVAHGSSSDFLDSSEITPYILFLKKYFCAIISILQSKIIHEVNNYKISNFGISVDSFHIYTSTLIGLSGGTKWQLNTGDEVFMKMADGKIKSSKIKNIKTYEGTDNVSIEIDGNIKRNSLIYLYNKKKYLEDSSK